MYFYRGSMNDIVRHESHPVSSFLLITNILILHLRLEFKNHWWYRMSENRWRFWWHHARIQDNGHMPSLLSPSSRWSHGLVERIWLCYTKNKVEATNKRLYACVGYQKTFAAQRSCNYGEKGYLTWMTISTTISPQCQKSSIPDIP